MSMDPLLSLEDVLGRLRPIIHGQFVYPISRDDYTQIYSCVYRACTQRPPNNLCKALYDAIGTEFTAAADSIVSMIFSWPLWRINVMAVSTVCKFLDRSYSTRLGLPQTREVGACAFIRILVAKIQPIRLLNSGVQVCQSALTLPGEEFDKLAEHEVRGLRVAELREELLTHDAAADTRGIKLTLVHRLVEAKRAVAIAAVRMEWIRVLRPVAMLTDIPVGMGNGDGLLEVVPLVIAAILKQKAHIEHLMGKWRRLALQVGHFAFIMRNLLAHVRYRPGGAGAKRARDQFEEMAAATA